MLNIPTDLTTLLIHAFNERQVLLEKPPTLCNIVGGLELIKPGTRLQQAVEAQASVPKILTDLSMIPKAIFFSRAKIDRGTKS